MRSEKVEVTAKFRFWAKITFICMKIGSEDFVYNKRTNLPVVMDEQLFEKIQECHLAVGHSGRDKTWAEVNSHG